MLSIADHHLGDTNLTRSAKCLMQNCVGFFPALLRLKEICLVEKFRIDLLRVYEIGDVDGIRDVPPHLIEGLIFHHNVTTSFIFKAFYDLIGGNLPRVGFRHFFVFDRTEIAGTKLPETKLLLSRGWINGHGNVDQPKADAAFPDGAHTRECFPIVLRLSTLDSPW